MSDNEVKIPRVIRKVNTLRRTQFNENIMKVPESVAAMRLEICKKCSTYTKEYDCEASGNFMPITVRKREAQCPYGHFTSWYPGDPVPDVDPENN